MTGYVINVRTDILEIHIMISVHQNAKHVYRLTSVPVAQTDTGEISVQHVTLTVRAPVIKLLVIANVRTVTLPTKAKVSAKHVLKTVKTKHAMPILECVIKVALMEKKEITVILHAARNVIEHVPRILDIVYSVKQSIFMEYFVMKSVVHFAR